MDIKSIIVNIVEKKLEKDSDDPCWDRYVRLGTKKKGGKEVPNCVPTESVELDESVKTEIPKALYNTILKGHGPKKLARTPKGEMKYRAAEHMDFDKKTETHILQTYSHPDHGVATIEKRTHKPTGDVTYFIYHKGKNEEVELDERVEVDHSRYMRSHSKKARGRGMWMFTTKDMGEPSEDETVTVSGDLSTAAKEAAKKLGTKRVYVMEMVDLDEVSMDKIRKVRDRAADRIAGAVGKTDKDPKTGLSRYVPPTDKEKELGQKGVKSFRAASRAITRKSKNEEVELDESFNLELGTKVAMKDDKGKTIYGKVIGKEKVMGEPGVEVKWDSGVKGRFKMSAFAGLSMDRKADYVMESAELGESFEVGDRVRNPYKDDMYGGKKRFGKVTAVRGTGKRLVVSVDWGSGSVDYLPNSSDKMDQLVVESVKLTENVHNDLNDAIFDFQRKLMRMKTKLDPSIKKEVEKIDRDLDELRAGPLHKIRPGR